MTKVWWIGVAALAGCAHGPTPEAQRAELSSYYPLAVGNRWVYDVAVLGEHTEQVVEIQKTADGYFVDGQGNQLAIDAFGVRDPKRYLLREPLEEGREWTNVVSVSSVEHYRILEAHGACDAPAGKFERCIKVQSRNRVDGKTTLVNDVTFAPGVGIVRLDVTAETSGKQIPQTHLELKSYRLASATP